jgi:hypothetical protein
MTRLGAALRALGGLGGSTVGSLIGMGAQGGNLGTGIGAALSKWLGSGDYVVAQNSIATRASAGMVPAMHKEGQSIIVRHREFLTEVRGSINFQVRNEFDLNPGLQTTFPWLCGIASQYSQYKIRGLVFHYVPTSGNAVSSTNAALGTVMLQTSYRATESPPASKIELLNEYWSSEAKPSEEFCHPIECDPKENPFNIQYIRTGGLPVTENQLMYDLGRTTVAVSGQQADNIVLGDLWVTYEIELKKPVLRNINNFDIQTGTSLATAGITNTVPFGTNQSLRFDSTAAGFDVTGTTITMRRGNTGAYSISIYYQGCTAIGTFSATIVNGNFMGLFGPATPVITSAYTVGTGAAVVNTNIVFSNPDLACSVTFSTATLTGASVARVVITEINPDARVD